jgi:hypothetical protein
LEILEVAMKELTSKEWNGVEIDTTKREQTMNVKN